VATNETITPIYNIVTTERGEDKGRISKQFNIPQKSESPELPGLQEFCPKTNKTSSII
jgi:hypothetical protein